MLAAVLLFATKSYDQCNDDDNEDIYLGLPTTPSSSHILTQALDYTDLAIKECEDEPVPLSLLQTLILITHWLLIQGVRGRAWRYLGVAVRIAYELNMHLIDANKSQDDEMQSEEWCEDEERRRAWWAIWEMDVFASVIRRCPTAIDWSQNETLLPAEEEKWLRREPQESCTLKLDPIERYKALEATRNQSPKAWFIVVNSLMKDAQKITSPIGVSGASVVTGRNGAARGSVSAKDSKNDANHKATTYKASLNRLRIIQNALQCSVMALPNSLKYRNQYLSFGTREMDHELKISRRLQHSSIYSIHVMVQLTKLMIYKYHIFRNGMEVLSSKDNCHHSSKDSRHSAVSQALEQYSEASDEIALLTGRSYDEHYRYVNPFLANTIWLAGAVQLLYRELASLDASDRELTNSKLELLSMTYNRFVSFWNMSPTLQKNLKVVETEIENLLSEAPKPSTNLSDIRNAQRPPSATRRICEPNENPGLKTGTTSGELCRRDAQINGKHELKCVVFLSGITN